MEIHTQIYNYLLGHIIQLQVLIQATMLHIWEATTGEPAYAESRSQQYREKLNENIEYKKDLLEQLQ